MKKLVIMRGLPGSGKSTKANSFGGLVLSTDDFFMVDGEYEFDVKKIGEAHAWNQMRCFNSMENEEELIVVDNTNTQYWEMKPYVVKAMELGYEVEFALPETDWAWNIDELFVRNTHGVPMFAIETMLGRFEKDATVELVLASESPF